VTNIGNSAEKVMGNLEKTTDTFANKDFNKDVRSSAHSLSNILDTLDTGQGYIPRLLRDDKEADRLSHAIANLDHATAQLDHTLAGVNAIVARVQNGPGFAHEVVYGEGGSKTLDHFGDAAEELAVTLRGVREGNGVAKSLIYGDDKSQQIMGNLNAASGDLRAMLADARAGKGTIGALLVDPSVYEDIKVLLGNVQRNQVLRSLVRYSIKRDEKQGGGVKDAAPASGTATAGGAVTASRPAP
jgi:phospholipid/cholesterol/gamma-HCH transport system substrate-binding protein